MRIGLLTTSFPRNDDDIAGAFVLGFARALAARGHSLEVLAPEPSEVVDAPSWPSVRTSFVPYLRPRTLQRTFYGAGVPDNLRRDPRAWLGLLPFSLALTSACRQRMASCDALVSHWALPCALAAGLARNGHPHLAVLHSADVHLLTRSPLRRLLARSLARSADAFWFVSQAHRQRVLACLPAVERAGFEARTHVSAMGVATPSATAAERARARHELGLEGFVALALGRLVPIKGVDVAIRACARADVGLLVVGDGPERQRLQQLARRLRANVRFLGTVTGHEKSRLLRAADALVLASRVLADGRSEGMPTVVLEALAHGLPVVATRTGGVPELLSHGDAGLLVAPEAEGELAQAIIGLRQDARLHARLRASGPVRAEAHAWPALAARVETLLANTSPATAATAVPGVQARL